MQTISAAQGLSRARPLLVRQTAPVSCRLGVCTRSSKPSSQASLAAAAAAPSSSRRPCRGHLVCRAADDRSGASKGGDLGSKFNPVYLAIFGVYAGLLVLKNPYIYAVLTVATILPQNSNVTSLNNLVLLFYESGLFTSFAEAVTCVRLVTWLSMSFMVISFSLVYA